MRADFPLLQVGMTVDQALAVIREKGVGERIIYFYVVEPDDRLAGVLPTRRLLTAQPDTPLADLMLRRVVAIPRTATLLDACDLFVLHKFFAFPVIDERRHVVGVLDIGVFTAEVLDLSEPEKVDDVFEARLPRLASSRRVAWKAFRIAFRGCSRRSPAAPLARCSREHSRRRSHARLWSHFSSRSSWRSRSR